MPAPRFIHLHNHSEYSLLDGAIRIKDLVEAARGMGMGAVALTDHGNMFGAVPFLKAATEAGIKPIVGMETYLAEGAIKEKSRVAGQFHNDHLTLLVTSEEGYRNLIELSSIAYVEGFYYRPRIDLELLSARAGGLIGMSGCLQGGVSRFLRADKWKEARALAERLSSILGTGRFYLEIQNHGIPEELALIPKMARLSAETGIPLVATNDCHYLKAEDHQSHDVLLCLQTGKDLDDPARVLRSNPETWFKTPEQMAALFPDHPKALEATLEIAAMCDFRLGKSSTHLPRFPLPPGFATAREYLEHVVMDNLPKRLAAVNEEALKRIRYELDVISRMSFDGYFLVVWDIVNAARERHIPVGAGRGSGAGSLVCYILGITSINPLENGLIFERLLNPERVSMPDIDVDFCDERRQEIIEYVIGKYGKENVCQIITFGRMAARAVVRDVGRVLKVPYGEVDKLAKMIPAQAGTTLAKALETVPELDALYKQDATVKKLIDLSFSLEGLARHASTHAAGIVITPTKLTDYVPLFRSNKGEVTTQYEMKILEDLGVLKIDILGLKTLSQIKNAIDLIERHEGVRIDPDAIPFDDDATFALFREGRTVGIFQVESSGMREVLRKIAPTKFEEIIAINALYRPGPLGSGMVVDFIDCKHGRKPIVYEDPRLEPILAETYGVILYQEQVMKIASELAGFTLGQADILRRAMGKKKKDEMEKQRERFIAGALERGLTKKKAAKIFDLINFFSGYGFNKSHSAAYAVITMQTAYLKAHYPAAFMAASMTCDMGDTDRLMVLLDECRNLGLSVHPPDVNAGGTGFGLANGEITYGLAAIKNVGVQAIESVVRARAAGSFTDIFDFCERVDLRLMNRRVIESLIQSGALDALPGTRAQKMGTLDRILARAQRRQSEKERGQGFLGFSEGASSGDAGALETVSDWDESTRLHHEKESLGFYFSGHPLDRHAEMLGRLISVDSLKLKEKRDREAVVGIGLVTDLRVILDRKGNPMAFVTVEDMHGSYEIIAFSDCYQKRRTKLQPDQIVVVAGKISVKDRGDVKIIADEVYTIGEAVQMLARKVHLTIRPEAFSESGLDRLRETLGRFPGEREIVFHIRANGSERGVFRARLGKVSPGVELLRELNAITGVEHVEVSS